jgi:UDP-N-acetylglucosamine--N-acetylmuramyl-(pentapeptide) pyrophosphoryl-undecaprenol N-acetylglucosamine transferase
MKGPDDPSFRMMLVAGGTGGHILHAIAFGDWLRREKPHVKVDYMSGSRKLELEIYRASNIGPFVVSASGSPIGVSPFRMIKRWTELGVSFLQALNHIKKFSPDICLLFGGYVSIPALFACKLKRIRVILHEQNARAGRVTRMAAKLSVPVASGWDDCVPLKDGVYRRVGIPVRNFRHMDKKTAWKLLGMEHEHPEGPVVSVMTGSLGSDRLSGVLEEISNREEFKTWNFFVIDPKAKAPERALDNITQLPQMWDITPFFAVSDLLVTRGGASTLAEVEYLKAPAIIAPWRGAADDHQMKNALSLSSSEKIRIWDEKVDSSADLAEKLQDLYDIFCCKNGDKENMLYNAGEAGENNCRSLWNFVADF